MWASPKAYYVHVSTTGAANPQMMFSNAFKWRGIRSSAQSDFSVGEFITNASTNGDAGIWNGNISFKFDNTGTDLDGFKTWLSTTPVQVIYKITPIEIPLTPTQVNSLVGQNYVWSDAGDVTVEYRAQ